MGNESPYSLNDSDSAADMSPYASNRGTNDSAYQSDRQSYSSRKPRQRLHSCEDTSEDSSPE